MEFSEDFVLPEIEVTTKPVPEIQANDEAFYAAGTYGKDPINDYTKMYGELTQNGYSQSLEDAKKAWMIEQSATNKEAVLGIINDPTIERDKKRDILSTYAVSGYISNDLKDKYVQRMGSLTMGDTHLDDQSQDTNVNLIPTKQAEIKERKNNFDYDAFLDSVIDGSIQTIDFITPGRIVRNPDGTINFGKTLSPKQISKDVTGEVLGLMNFFSSLPTFFQTTGVALGSVTRQALNNEHINWQEALAKGEEYTQTNPIGSFFDLRLLTIVKKLGIEKEFEAVKQEFEGSTVNNFTNGFGTIIQKLDEKSAEAGITKPGQVQVITDAAMIFGGPLYKTTKAGIKKINKTIDEGTSNVFQVPTIDIRPDSPLDNTVAANPAAAAKVIEAGIKDDSGQTATATGAGEPGVLVHKYVLPKTTEKAADVRNNPDLHQEIIKLNKNLEQVLEDTQFDPNVINVEQRSKDITAVNKVINSLEAPTYMQANSLVNVADTLFQVKAVFGRDSNYFFNSRESVITAFDNLKRVVEALPEDERGSVYITDRITGQKYTPDSLRADPKYTADVMDNKQFAVEWEYNKEYDLLESVLSGPDSVKTVLDFGVKFDVSKIAQTTWGKWITPSGKFAPWIEQGLARQAERTAYLSSQTLNIVKQKLGDGRLKPELAQVVQDAQTSGKELFTKAELTQKFPKLSTKDIDALFEKQVYWRQVNYFDLALTDRARRNELLGKGYDKGIYKDGKYAGAVRTDFAFIGEGNLAPKTVWDLTLDMPVEFELDKSKTDAIYNVGGKQLVVLEKSFTDMDTGSVYEYGLVGDRVKIDILPQKLIRRIPGYSPILYKEHFFIDAKPKELTVNGFKISDKTKLENYSRSVAAATTKYEADALLTEFQRRMPDHELSLRKAREESLSDKVSLYEVHGDVVRNALRRGERLPSLHGPARIEDPLTALIKTSQSLARMDAMRSYKEVFETYFIKNYKEFLPRLAEGEFPPRIELIEPLPRAMSVAEKAKYEKAKAEFEQYSTVNSFADWTDSIPSALVGLADVLEKYKVPGNVLREVGNKNMIINAPKRIASLFYITLNVPRQWFVQTQPIFELVVSNPIRGPKNVALMLATRLALLDEAKMLKPYKSLISNFAHNSVKTLVDKAEFEATIKAIKESGLLQSVDQNLLVNQILVDSTRPLVETPLEKGMAATTAAPKAVTKLARAVGFDAAELSNRLFMWLHAKDLWMDQNPGKPWNTPKAKEAISYEAWRLSGSMSKAGALPYQTGALSFLMQFAAITQKQFLLGFQEGGSILSRADRAKLLASRALLWGAYGVIGGKLLMDFLSSSQDPDIIKAKEEIRKGAYDRVMNNLFKALAGDDIDPKINFSKDINPYGESGLGIPYIDLMVEIVKMLNGDSNGFRFPALSALGRIPDTINTLNSWLATKEITGQSFSRVALEASRFASGMDNWAKAQLMLAVNDKITKQGKPLGLESTRAEAFAQVIGFTTTKEEDIWAAANVKKDRTTEVKDMASNIHRELIKIISDPAIKNDPNLERTKRDLVNSFLSTLQDDDGTHWDKDKIKEVKDQIWELDKESRRTLKKSLIDYTWTKMNNQYNENNQKLENLLKDKKNDETFKLLNTIHGRENP